MTFDESNFDKIREAIADVQAGRMVILVDDEDRENEGDICMAAEKVTPEAINFMAKHARGLICLTLTEERLRQLDIPMMVTENTSMYGTAFTVSIEARHGVSTGISAADRAHTIKTALAQNARPQDLTRPGHIFPLRARKGGVLVRTGQTEGSVDMARLAGLQPAGVICEIMNDDGTMARMGDLEKFGKEHGLRIISVAELIEYRLAHESFVHELTTRTITHPTWGELTLHVFGTALDDRQHLAVVKGNVHEGRAPLVRVQAGFPAGNALADLFSEERRYLEAALNHMRAEERGVLVCLDTGPAQVSLEERVNRMGEPGKKPQPDAVNQGGVLREFGVGAQVLRALELKSIRLLTSHPRKIAGLDGYGLKIEEIIPVTEDVKAHSSGAASHG